jgi:cytidylate kinase
LWKPNSPPSNTRDTAKELFHQDIHDLGAFDLVINTDHIPVEAAPDIILYAMERAGFEVSKRAAKSRSGELAAA